MKEKKKLTSVSLSIQASSLSLMKLLSDLSYIKKNEKLHKKQKLKLNLNKKSIPNSLLSGTPPF